MKYTVNKHLQPGYAIVTVNFNRFGTVRVGNIAIGHPIIKRAYDIALKGYTSPSQGYPQYFAAEKLVERFGGEIVMIEIGESAGAMF